MKYTPLYKHHGRETIGGRGQVGNKFQMRGGISGGMPSFNTTTGKMNYMMKSTWRKLQTQVTICGRISQKRSRAKQPKYISKTDWATILKNWNTEEVKAKSQSAVGSRTSAPPGKKMHNHGAGPRTFLNIEYKMMVDESLDEPPPFTALVKKTHMGKDGSFIDQRAEELGLEVEQAVEEMTQNGSPLTDSQTDSTAATPSSKRLLLNQEYIKRGHTHKSTVYGLGSVQFKNITPSVPVPLTLKRNLDMEMRMSSLETTAAEVKADVNALKTELKEEMSATRQTLNMFLQVFLPQAQAQVHHTASASTPQPSQPQDQDQAQPDAQDLSLPQPQHLTTDNKSDLDRWCQRELGF